MLVTGGLQERLVLVGELDEDVLKAWSERANFGDGDAVLQKLLAKLVEIEVIVDERVDRLSKDGGAANAGDLAREAQSAGDFRRGDFDAQCALRLNVRKLAQRIGCAIGDELAVVDVRDVAATFRFVHIVRSDKKSDAVAGKLEEQIPQLPTRHGIDAGGGLIEEKQL